MTQTINATLEACYQVLSSIPDAALVVDESGDIVRANEVAVALFGGDGVRTHRRQR
ncbi:MAG: PAS domain-containing protein [Halospina sp.]